MFRRTHGKPHTETYRFSATPTLSDFPLLIGEMVRLSDLRFKRQAQRRSLSQKIRASWAILFTPKHELQNEEKKMVPGITCDDDAGHDGAGIERSGAGFDPVDLRCTGHVHTQKDERSSSQCGAFQRDHSRWL